MHRGWWTEPTALGVILVFGSVAVWILGYALFGVIPAFAFMAVFAFLLARAAAPHLRRD